MCVVRLLQVLLVLPILRYMFINGTQILHTVFSVVNTVRSTRLG